jgi:hypothetical protein
LPDIGPSAAHAFSIAAWPLAISSVSPGSIHIITWDRSIDSTMENGAAAISHCSQGMSWPSIFWMKPIATMFCPVAVFTPTFHTLTAWTVDSMTSAASRLRRSTPNASTMPSTIGITATARAVACAGAWRRCCSTQRPGFGAGRHRLGCDGGRGHRRSLSQSTASCSCHMRCCCVLTWVNSAGHEPER